MLGADATALNMRYPTPTRYYPRGRAKAPDIPEPFQDGTLAHRIEPGFARAWLLGRLSAWPWPMIEYRDSKWHEHPLPRPAAAAACESLGAAASWIDRKGLPWVVFASSGAKVIGKWDGTRWRLHPVPKGFAVDRIVASSSTDMWLLAAGQVSYWDGTQVTTAELQLGEVTASWMAPDGSLWVAGPEKGKRDAVALLHLQRKAAAKTAP